MYMKQELIDYLERLKRIELKWMYHFDVDDDDFGLSTDLYQRICEVLRGDTTVEYVLSYLERNYGEVYSNIIANIKELSK